MWPGNHVVRCMVELVRSCILIHAWCISASAVYFPCPVTDISATAAPICVEFCIMVHIGSGQVFPFWGNAPSRSHKSEILGLNFGHLTTNISKTISRSVTYQLELITQARRELSKNISQSGSRDWVCSFLTAHKHKKGYLVPFKVAPSGVHYKQKHVVFWAYLHHHHLWQTRSLMRGRATFVYSASMINTIGRIPSECWRRVTYSSDGPDTRRQSGVFHTSPALDAAVNFNGFLYAK